jgi:hypothetical protein
VHSPRIETPLLVGTGLLLIIATWAWGGIHRVWLPVLAGLSVVLFGILAYGSRTRLFRDSFFWAGLAFLTYLALQWWNAGRTAYFDVGYRTWTYTPPPHGLAWPWAFTRTEAAQMLLWFFPAWTFGLALRSPQVSRKGVVTLTRGLVYAAGALALAGTAQFLTETTRLFWLWPVGCEFFASFAYTNHAAAYFVLMGSVTAGLLFRATFRQVRQPQSHRVVLVVILGLCLLGANLSLSRAGVILAWALAATVAVYGLRKGWSRARPVGRLNLLVAMIVSAGIFYFAVSGFGNSAIREQFKVKRAPVHQMIPALAGINLDLSVRPELARIALDMWQAHRWLGVGGWGYRYLQPFHVPREQWDTIRRSKGWANVHNDPLQFLAEFGLIGGGLMALALATLIVPLFGRDIVRGSVFAMAGTGLALALVFSLIDLPFRCPAILWTWVAILAAIPKLTRHVPPQPSTPGPHHEY